MKALSNALHRPLYRSVRQSTRRLAVAFALVFCGFPIAWADEPAKSFVDMLKAVELMPVGTGNPNSELLAKITEAVDLIKRLGLPKAHLAINEALQLNPRSSQLHFLNGFIYHLQARQGDTQKSELALEGYQQALRLDPSNWIAQEFLGLAYIDFNRFELAKLAFSEALLYRPDSAPSIYGLMTATYLTGDANTACAMADQYLKVSASPPLNFLRSSITVYASCGKFVRAAWVRDALVQYHGDGPDLARIDRRVAQWQDFYRRQTQASHQKQTSQKQHVAATLAMDLSSNANDYPIVLAQAFTLPNTPYPHAAESTQSTDSKPPNYDNATEASSPPAAAVPSESADQGPRMLLVDVVLLSTQEQISTSKGVNLLSALTLQLGSLAGNLPAYSRVNSSDKLSGASATENTSITRAVTIPALSYSLNIANANSSVNEVLARPTLAAIEGMPSEFFSGTNLSAGVVSTSQQGGTTIVPLEKRFGIKLAVTPNFLPEGKVQLKVEAQRTSLNASSDNPRVAYQIEIGETTANANVVMNLGDTLMLSGLSEKSSSSTRDGVPGLQDVPGAQYLFSNKRTNQLQRSVLILVTPRASVPMAITNESDGEQMAARMKQLRERFGFTDNLPANIEAVMTQLQGNDYFREFRQGDVALEHWDRMRTTGDRLKEALSFLYY